MLVLSRRPSEKVVFPSLGISVEILRVSGKAVSVGIEAPRDVRILRDELPDIDPVEPAVDRQREVRHALRNRLHAANLALHLARKQLQVGRATDAESTLEKALGELGELDQFVRQTGENSGSRVKRDRRRALLVEDDANECELLAGYLRMSGYVVDTARNGEEALRLLAEQPQPDVVLLDMRMPVLDGPDTVSSIRRCPELKGLRLFAVSGTPRDELTVGLGPGGVDRWFSKPLDPAKLVEAMNRDLVPTGVSA